MSAGVASLDITGAALRLRARNRKDLVSAVNSANRSRRLPSELGRIVSIHAWEGVSVAARVYSQSSF